PRWRAEVADHEALEVALWFSAEASAAAAAARRETERALEGDDWRPRVGEHVVLRGFRYDVVSLAFETRDGRVPEPDARVTRLAMCKRVDGSGVTDYRLGPLAFEALTLCDGSRLPGEVCAAVAEGARAEP